MAQHRDDTARLMVYSAIFWLVLAITLGLIQALEFIAPDFLAGISWLVFPRIRQAHVNGLAFGWLSMAMVAGWYYIVPRLTKTEIYSEKLGIFIAWAWNLALAVGVVGLTLGWTQAREYAELAWPVDIAIMVVLLLTAFNLFKTIGKREEPSLYVSLWYVMGTLLWFPIVYAIGNVIWAPPTGALMGLNDAIWNWFYGHNILVCGSRPAPLRSSTSWCPRRPRSRSTDTAWRSSPSGASRSSTRQWARTTFSARRFPSGSRPSRSSVRSGC
jgi:cytochrome c oxidase cbb3-type subunit I/II